MYEEEVSICLTDDEIEIIYNAIKNIEETEYYGLGFDVTVTSLLEKIDKVRKG